MRHLDLFSGIGGFAYAAQQVWEVYETVAFVEWDGFCQQVLKKNFPGVPIHEDIRTFTNTKGVYGERAKQKGNRRGKPKEEVRNESCDIVTGGFPCQPFSQAGRRKGTADDRHLWPEMFRVIREWKPRWVIGENVAGLLTWSEGLVLKQITTDLESESYEVQCFVIPAVSVNAPHRRDRVWIVAHSESNDNRGKLRASDDEKKAKQRSQDKHQNQTKRSFSRSSHDVVGNSEHNGQWEEDWTQVATELCGVDDGLSAKLDGFELTKAQHRKERLKSLGNAIVPQVAIEIMKGIKSINTKEEV